jgi:hypothetical protein
MSALLAWEPSDRLIRIMYAGLFVATLAVAAEAHAFCRIYCIHGDEMTFVDDVCSSRSAP